MSESNVQYAIQFHAYTDVFTGHMNVSIIKLVDGKESRVVYGGNQDTGVANVRDETARYYSGENSRIDSQLVYVDESQYNDVTNLVNSLVGVSKPYIPYQSEVNFSNGWTCGEFAQGIYDIAGNYGGSVLMTFSKNDILNFKDPLYVVMIRLADGEYFSQGNIYRTFQNPGNLFVSASDWDSVEPSSDKLFGTIPAALRSSQISYSSACGSFSPSDPLIFDLNGDGVQTTALTASKAFFDIDGDGFAERTEWASGGDGMLAFDANGNGSIDDISELFGDDTSANGIAKLKTYDLNSDNRIDANDSVFSQLKIWQDANENGITDSGELKTLADWNIASIGLAASPT